MKKTWFKTFRQNATMICLVVLFVGLIILLIVNSYSPKATRVDDVIQDSIKTEITAQQDSINLLDSIKNEYINKANSLNDSDAINLFYKLLGK